MPIVTFLELIIPACSASLKPYIRRKHLHAVRRRCRLTFPLLLPHRSPFPVIGMLTGRRIAKGNIVVGSYKADAIKAN